MELLTIAGGLIAVSVVTSSGVRGLRAWALRQSLLDIPNQRSCHVQPTPRGGGLVIALVTIGGWIGLGMFSQPAVAWGPLAACAFGASLIAVVGWLDDLYGLSAATRLAAHGLAAVVAIVALGYWETIPLWPGQSIALGYAGAAITLFWIVGLTNAYNFMDGTDGIAGSQAVIAGLGWACLGWLADSPTVMHLSLLLAAASLGFLRHNWPPARIFMGDVGSAFLGYSFAILPLFALHGGGKLADASLFLGPLLVWPFVFDSALTFLRRLRGRENVFAAHRSHLFQRLILAGYSHRFVLLLYSGMALVGVAAGVFWLVRPVAALGCSAVVFPSLAAMLYRFVTVQERRAEETEEAPRILPMPTPKRRAA